MALENDPSSKMQIRSLGELLHPGACFSCGNGSFEGDYLDLGVFFDYEGTLYLCRTCGEQVGETLGMFTQEEHLKVVAEAGSIYTKVDILEEELRNVRAQLDAARLLFNDLPILKRGLAGPSSEKPEAASGVDSELTEESVSGESEVTEPVTSTGRTDTERVESSDSSTSVTRTFH